MRLLYFYYAFKDICKYETDFPSGGLIVVSFRDRHPYILRIVSESFAENVKSTHKFAVFFTFHFEKASVARFFFKESERTYDAAIESALDDLISPDK